MINLLRAGALALALCSCSAAMAQEAIKSPTVTIAPAPAAFDDGTGHASHVSATNGLPTRSVDVGAKGDAAWNFTDLSPSLMAMVKADALKSKAVADLLAGGINATVNFPSSFQVSNFPTSFQVSNFPSAFAIANLPADPATATNQGALNTTAATMRDEIGSISSPAAGTVNAQLATAVAKLSAVVTALQGMLSVQLPSLPAYAATPTFNIGTAPQLNVNFAAQSGPIGISASTLPLPAGAAPASGVAGVVAALGSPFQAGGSIGNASFGATQSGAWDVRNVTGTVALPTGAATDATLTQIKTAMGSPLLAGGSVSVSNNTDPATGTKQTANTNAITATQSALGTSATTAVTIQGAASGVPLPVSGTITTVLPQVAAVDYGGLFGTSSTQLFPANAARHGIQVQVQSSAVCYLRATSAATTDYHSMMITGPGGMFESSSHVGTSLINIVCTAANVSVYARDF